MKRSKATGIFNVSGVGQAILDIDGLSIALSGEAKLDGMVRQAVVTMRIPNDLMGVFTRALDHPVEQIPMYRPGLVSLQIRKA